MGCWGVFKQVDPICLISSFQLYRLMSEGQAVPNNVVDDLLAEAMVAAAEKSKVKHPPWVEHTFDYLTHTPCIVLCLLWIWIMHC